MAASVELYMNEHQPLYQMRVTWSSVSFKLCGWRVLHVLDCTPIL